jgi:hypothetical protein
MHTLLVGYGTKIRNNVVFGNVQDNTTSTAIATTATSNDFDNKKDESEDNWSS